MMLSKKALLGYSLGPIGSSILSLMLIPVMAWGLSSDRVADYSLLTILCSIFLLFSTFGADQYMIRNYHSSENKDLLLNESLSVSLVFSFLLVFILFSFDLVNLISFSDEIKFDGVLKLAFIILIANINRFFATLLRLQESAIQYSITNLIPKFVFLFSIVFISVYEYSVSLDVLLNIILFGVLSNFLTMQCFFKFRLIKKIKINLGKFKCVISYGVPMLFSGLAYWGLQATDRLMLSELADREELAIYSIAIQMAGLAMLVQSVISIIWTPLALKVISNSEGELSTNFEKKVEEVSLLFGKLILLVLLLVNMFSWLVPYFLPATYNDIYKILTLCMLPPLLYALSECT
ncbi:oligosaccharide flippase family protein, partial [Shewanella chilikensis]|uniref:oligosaccharide flippase family protein n=1 Tax=Shewanella chilikensis TaxID=558541 RepID=UPI001F49050D